MKHKSIFIFLFIFIIILYLLFGFFIINNYTILSIMMDITLLISYIIFNKYSLFLIENSNKFSDSDYLNGVLCKNYLKISIFLFLILSIHILYSLTISMNIEEALKSIFSLLLLFILELVIFVLYYKNYK